MVGKEKGAFKSFNEIAGGAATDAGIGFEIGRVDITGNPNDFNSSFLYGVRDKAWISLSPSGEVISVGGAFAWSTANGRSVYATSIQIGLGVSPIPFISGGYNNGVITK